MQEPLRKNPEAAAGRPLIIAHRGASGLAPENTLTAFQLALAMGADGIELDVNLAADGTPVVIHDRRLKRTTNRAGFVSDLAAVDLQQLDAGSWFARRLALRPRARRLVEQAVAQYGEVDDLAGNRRLTFADQFVPTLEDVFSLLAPANLTRLYVELKGEAASKSAMLEATLALVRRFQMQQTVTFLSFDHQLMAEAKTKAPELRTALTLPVSRNALVSARAISQAVERAAADEVALHFGLATRRLVAALHERGLAVSVWTANNRVLMRRLIANGVDAIMTNYPNRLRETLASVERIS